MFPLSVWHRCCKEEQQQREATASELLPFRRLLWGPHGGPPRRQPLAHDVQAAGHGARSGPSSLSGALAAGRPLLALLGLYHTEPVCRAMGTKVLCVTQGNREPRVPGSSWGAPAPPLMGQEQRSKPPS